MIIQRDLPLLVRTSVMLQMFVTTGRKFVRSETDMMIAIFAFFLAASSCASTCTCPDRQTTVLPSVPDCPPPAGPLNACTSGAAVI